MPAICRARVATIDIPLETPLQAGQHLITSRQYCCLTVELSDGSDGEAYVLTRGLPVQDVLTRLVLPLASRPERPSGRSLLANLRNSGWSGPISRAVSLIQLAALDADARARGLPVWRLRGLDTEPKPAIAAVIGYTAVDANPASIHDRDLAHAREAIDHGATLVKLMAGFDAPEHDARRAELLAAELGTAATVGIDLNGAWPEDVARALLPRLSARGVRLVEDPYPYEQGGVIPPTDMQGLEVAMGEVLASPLEILAVLPAVTHLRPDVTLLGGPDLFDSACLRARRAGLGVMPHFWPEYHRHLLPAPADGIVDYLECTIGKTGGFERQAFIENLPAVSAGTLDSGSEPSFGFGLNWTAISRLAGGALVQINSERM